MEGRMVRKRVSPTWRSLHRFWMQELKGEKKVLETLEVQEENRKGGNPVTRTGQKTYQNIKRACVLKEYKENMMKAETRDLESRGHYTGLQGTSAGMGLTKETVVKFIPKIEIFFKADKLLLLLPKVLRRL